MKGANLGQHFLVNNNVAEKIARQFLPAQGPILEIGPGRGILTDLLLKYRAENGLNPFTAIELDYALFYQLKNKYAHLTDFEVQNRDILKIDLHHLFPAQSQTVNIIGNVPYYISKELMDWVLTYHKKIKKGIFMMQKEFVDKVKPLPGSDQTNAQSVLLNYLFEMRALFDVLPGSFSPQPRVKSTVFQFAPFAQEQLPESDIHRFYLFVQRCFMNRRKTLLNNLANAVNTETLWHIFETHHINSMLRAEQTTLAEFLLLYRCLQPPQENRE